MVYGTSFEPGSAVERDTIAALVRDAAPLLKKGRPVGIADLRFVNKADPALVRGLTENVDISQLAAFSGWNTASNALGTAIAHLAAYRLMPAGLDRLPAAERANALAPRLAAHAAFLMQRFFEDYLFMAQERSAFVTAIQALGQSPFRISGASYPALREGLKRSLLGQIQLFFDAHFKDRALSARVARSTQRFRIKALNVSMQLPWFRAFEAGLDVGVELKEELFFCPRISRICTDF